MADLSLHDQARPAFDPFVIESAPAEVLLDQLVHVTDRIKHYTRWKQLLNDALTLRHELGQLAESQEHDGCLIFYSAGRLSYAYPPAVKELEAALQEARDTAVALGQVKVRCGKPFWTVREAKP